MNKFEHWIRRQAKQPKHLLKRFVLGMTLFFTGGLMWLSAPPVIENHHEMMWQQLGMLMLMGIGGVIALYHYLLLSLGRLFDWWREKP